MNKIKALLIGAALSVASATAASAVTVTLDGKNGSQTLDLTAGIYSVDVSKDAWSAWSTGARWLNAYFVDPANSGRKRVNDGTQYATVGAAVNASQAYTFNLDADQKVSFYILDFGNVSDNRGQLTLDLQQIAAVPVPAAGLLLLTGLLVPVAMRRRKKA